MNFVEVVSVASGIVAIADFVFRIIRHLFKMHAKTHTVKTRSNKTRTKTTQGTGATVRVTLFIFY